MTFSFAPGALPSVLVVDDDPDIRELVAISLERLGVDVSTAPNGEAGLEAASWLRPDLILLDWVMPGLSGLEVCRRLRNRAGQTQVPIVLLTGRAQEADVKRGFAAGADDYILKPFSPDHLALRVEELLAPAPR